MIQTVTGPVSADALRTTLMHEHFVFGFPGYQGDLTCGPFDHDGFLREVCAHLSALKRNYELGTIVDATANECGRDPALLREVSERAGINIICSTGYYTEATGGSVYFKLRAAGGADISAEAEEMMRVELYEGIGKTGIRAGVIKLATGRDVMSPYEEAFFAAASRIAATDPEIRIITHTEAGTCAADQARYFASHGVPASQVSIGHIDDCTDMDTLLTVLEMGFYVSFDRMGFNGFFGAPMDSRRLACLCGLIGAGYGDHILLSHDYVFRDLGRKPVWPEDQQKVIDALNWSHIFRDTLPALQKTGVPPQKVHALVTDNPARFWAG